LPGFSQQPPCALTPIRCRRIGAARREDLPRELQTLVVDGSRDAIDQVLEASPDNAVENGGGLRRSTADGRLLGGEAGAVEPEVDQRVLVATAKAGADVAVMLFDPRRPEAGDLFD
jgi:hypothetical protein